MLYIQLNPNHMMYSTLAHTVQHGRCACRRPGPWHGHVPPARCYSPPRLLATAAAGYSQQGLAAAAAAGRSAQRRGAVGPAGLRGRGCSAARGSCTAHGTGAGHGRGGCKWRLVLIAGGVLWHNTVLHCTLYEGTSPLILTYCTTGFPSDANTTVLLYRYYHVLLS